MARAKATSQGEVRRTAACFRAAATAAAITCGQAQANVFPAFDFSASCKYLVAQKNYIGAGFPTCVTEEQQAFQDLLAAYRYIPDAVASACERTTLKATGGQGSYAMLKACLAQPPAR